MTVKIEELRKVLIQAIEAEGFSVSGPTDVRAAEHGEPAWVCNARAALAEHHLSGEEVERRGKLIAERLGLKKVDGDRYETVFGEKTDIGIFMMAKELIDGN